MSESTLTPALAQPRANSANADVAHADASILASLGLVVGFWWAATGLTLAMQRSALTSTTSLVLATLCAVLGVRFIVRSRDDLSVPSVRRAFLGSALLWWWCSTIFYAGFGIRIADDVARGPRTFALALQAIAATLRPDLVGVAALVLVAWLVRHRVNRTAIAMLATFWGTLQLAKLNVFMGVRNAGIDWLPDHLEGLSRYYGPPQNSALLPTTIVVLSLVLAAVTVPAWRATETGRRHLYAMLSVLIALAVLEHVALGIDLTLPLWDIFKPLPHP